MCQNSEMLKPLSSMIRSPNITYLIVCDVLVVLTFSDLKQISYKRLHQLSIVQY